jgi:hypothetical protein
VAEPEETPGTARFELVFEASGCVCKGDGPDALEVPKQEENDQ